ncbi:velvet factor-domain-containing protein [Thamnidium elegans]|nr:velvet factor-domain-containing protein [Thamnidium elegans]
MDETVSYHFATVKQRRENRHEIDYQLTLRQQPKQSRMCGVGEKADRRPIDPPPIVQLKVIDSKLPLTEKNYLQNPYYFMYASLMAADLDEELHLLRDGKTRSTTGSVVSSLYHLKDIDNTDAGFFVFPDLSVRMEGSYRLKLSLFEIIGKEVFHCRSIISNKFFVYSAKKFPGMEESTFLSRSFADQGLKIRIRKELRQRRKLSKISDSEENNNNSDNNSNDASTKVSTKKQASGKRARIIRNDDDTAASGYVYNARPSSWVPPMMEKNKYNAVIGTDRPTYFLNNEYQDANNTNNNHNTSRYSPQEIPNPSPYPSYRPNQLSYFYPQNYQPTAIPSSSTSPSSALPSHQLSSHQLPPPPPPHY